MLYKRVWEWFEMRWWWWWWKNSMSELLALLD
jgi:hypothetical protein